MYVSLTAEDGHRLGAYEARPEATAKGDIVVLQEIFGVNAHIRAVCDRLAALGYRAVAPALFDRIRSGFQSGYSAAEVEAAKTMLGNFDWEKALLDVKAVLDHLGPNRPVVLIGFCLGGSLAHMAAIRFEGLAAAMGYYGGKSVEFADVQPNCPTLLHYGDEDRSIPMADIRMIQEKAETVDGVEVRVYHAGHGFNCDQRASFEPQSATLAWERTMALIERAVKNAGDSSS